MITYLHGITLTGRNQLNLFTPKQSVRLAVDSINSMDSKPVENTIRGKLTAALNPVHLNIINESYMHNVPKGSETHFKVVLVSKEFENKSLLQVGFLIC